MVHTESFFPNPWCLSARLLFTFSTLSAPIPVDQGGIHHMNMFSRLVLTQILLPQASVPSSPGPGPLPPWERGVLSARGSLSSGDARLSFQVAISGLGSEQ